VVVETVVAEALSGFNFVVLLVVVVVPTPAELPLLDVFELEFVVVVDCDCDCCAFAAAGTNPTNIAVSAHAAKNLISVFSPKKRLASIWMPSGLAHPLVSACPTEVCQTT
jgi:hypothetical protein